jgi:hypothetical protein
MWIVLCAMALPVAVGLLSLKIRLGCGPSDEPPRFIGYF